MFLYLDLCSASSCKKQIKMSELVTAKRKASRQGADHEMNPPKRAKVEKLSEKELWGYWYYEWAETDWSEGEHYIRKYDPVYYEGFVKELADDFQSFAAKKLFPGIEKEYITMWDEDGNNLTTIEDMSQKVVIRLNPNTLINKMHIYLRKDTFEDHCMAMEENGWYMTGVRHKRG